MWFDIPPPPSNPKRFTPLYAQKSSDGISLKYWINKLNTLWNDSLNILIDLSLSTRKIFRGLLIEGRATRIMYSIAPMFAAALVLGCETASVSEPFVALQSVSRMERSAHVVFSTKDSLTGKLVPSKLVQRQVVAEMVGGIARSVHTRGLVGGQFASPRFSLLRDIDDPPALPEMECYTCDIDTTVFEGLEPAVWSATQIVNSLPWAIAETAPMPSPGIDTIDTGVELELVIPSSSPPTMVRVSVDGIPASEVSLTWSPVSGGWILDEAAITGFDDYGVAAFQVNVTGTGVQYSMESSASRPSTLAMGTLRSCASFVGALILPVEAHALGLSSGCFGAHARTALAAASWVTTIVSTVVSGGATSPAMFWTSAAVSGTVMASIDCEAQQKQIQAQQAEIEALQVEVNRLRNRR